jgi:4-hydroxy-3-methylbut-2-enyl diphosphate reductase
MTDASHTLFLAAPRGFCAGVDRAIDIVDMALQVYGAPIYVRHEIVHNRHVVDELRGKGAIFTDDLADVPSGAVVIFSAHGVSPAVRREAEARGLHALDATCPLVTKVHLEALRYAKEGFTIVLIGHRNHVEVQGTLGEAPHCTVVVETVADVETLALPDPNRVAYISQTTLSVDDVRAIVEALKKKFPAIREPAKADICYATQNRQDAMKELSRRCKVVLVVGAPTSSNANRLVEVARQHGARAHLIEAAEDIRAEWIGGDVGITAGASTPEDVVQACVERVRALGSYRVEEFRLVEERVMFPLPGELLAGAREKGVAVAAGNERAAARATGASRPDAAAGGADRPSGAEPDRGPASGAEFRIRHH